MAAAERCLVVVPADAPELYARLVSAFLERPDIFVLRDRRIEPRGLRSVEVFAVGGGELEPNLRREVEEELRRLGARP